MRHSHDAAPMGTQVGQSECSINLATVIGPRTLEERLSVGLLKYVLESEVASGHFMGHRESLFA